MLNSPESLALALSIFSVSLGIVSIALVIRIYNKQSEGDDQLKNLVEDIGDVTHDIGRLTTAQTRMVTTMSELITQQNDRYEKRKNFCRF